MDRQMIGHFANRYVWLMQENFLDNERTVRYQLFGICLVKRRWPVDVGKKNKNGWPAALLARKTKVSSTG